MANRPFMTKKHYELIADIIYGFKEDGMHEADVSQIAYGFADKLKETNPLFKSDLFLNTCGVLDGTNNTSSGN